VGAGQNHSVEVNWPTACQLAGPPKEQGGYSEGYQRHRMCPALAMHINGKTPALAPFCFSKPTFLQNTTFSGRNKKSEKSGKG